MEQEKLVCYNRDLEGDCLAYKVRRCYLRCPARIATLEDKIKLLTSLVSRAQSRKDRIRMEKELALAKKAKELQDAGKYEGWMACYMEDRKRGEKGGASESDANRSTRMKALMKDNRPVDVKPTRVQQEEYKQALKEWEDEHGKLERLSRSSMSTSKVDSYTQEKVCFLDDGAGKCRGLRSVSGTLDKVCRNCEGLSPRQK